MTAEQSRQTGGYYAQQWTVRDEYAAAALQGQMANRQIKPHPNVVAEDCYAMADAMLTERRRRSGKELASDIAEVLSLPKRNALTEHEGEL